MDKKKKDCSEFKIIKLNKIILLPKLLLNKNILGNVAILKGIK
jgi:hypothetical protein